jgi:putative acetyltransferase
MRLFSEDLPGIFRRPVPSLEDEVEFISAHSSRPNSTLLLAEADGAVVGLIGMVGESLPEESHVGTFGASVDQGWRGRGVGGALLEALIAWAGEHGVTRIQAYVWATNPRALDFYERHGFEREGYCRRAIIRDGAPIDVHLIALLLDA